MKADWKVRTPNEEEGVLVGCTESQEWLIPWWWMNFKLFNNYPVTFVNFGDMSDKAVSWCQQRGHVITLDIEDSFISKREKIDPQLASLWEELYSQIWAARLAWFKKPFVLLETPYKRTVWLDLDCQVKGSLAPLFQDYLKSQIDVAVSPEIEIEQVLNEARGLLLDDEVMYNAGVIAFHHGAPLIQEWAKQSIDQNPFFMGDGQLLSRLIFTQKAPVKDLPALYNCPVNYGKDPRALILHWGGLNKLNIRTQIEALKEMFLINLFF